MNATPVYAIRRAGPADATLLSDLASRTFSETFGHLYPPEHLQRFLDDSYSLQAQARPLADPQCAVWLLERDGIAVGHALAGPCGLPHAEVAPGDGELKRLYVLREAQNGGWGGRLFQTALDWLLRDGPRTLWIGVWSENHGAQRFYARHGFVHVGDYEFVVGDTRDHEYILRRPAGSPVAG
ncbi:GNAT family N-acetyltransferase [Lysobacter silvisoli]|uniref:GNAT family N-acetyltransferase n=1 Tax=Lysobacter silvisoli TaxID=2293254 RepID=A0A371K6H4_9GAMM|nr:GNAT family N-acetyltransferase [Lysobacter silvisoli]RDZ29559.1 GNAT family N-acetyltransferase [Lysobacter silvisoli]